MVWRRSCGGDGRGAMQSGKGGRVKRLHGGRGEKRG